MFAGGRSRRIRDRTKDRPDQSCMQPEEQTECRGGSLMVDWPGQWRGDGWSVAGRKLSRRSIDGGWHSEPGQSMSGGSFSA
jgi:hypothetical protein